MSALLWKEFRETVRWFPLCLLLVASLIWRFIPGRNDFNAASILSANLLTAVGAAAIISSVALAIAQFALNQKAASRGFLLHRSLTARQIFLAKIIVGGLLYVLAIFVPLSATAVYLEWIGPERLPTSWHQTVPAFSCSFFGFSFYFGTSMVICRPARWFGTRLLPIAAPVLIIIATIWVSLPMVGAILVFLMGLVGCLVLALASLAVFETGENSIAPVAKPEIVFPIKSTLFISSIIFATAVFSAPTFIIEPTNYNLHSVDFDGIGEPWLVHYHSIVGYNANQVIAHYPMVEDKTQGAAKYAPSDGKEMDCAWFSAIQVPAGRVWDFQRLKQSTKGTWFFDESGRILSYEFIDNQIGVINFRVIEKTPIAGAATTGKEKFAHLNAAHVSETKFGIDVLLDANGVYAIGPKNGVCFTLLDRPIDGFTDRRFGEERMVTLALANQGTISHYHFEKSDESPAGIELKLDASFDVEVSRKLNYSDRLNFLAPDNWTLVTQSSPKEYRITRMRPSDEKSVSYTYGVPFEQNSESTKRLQRLIMGLIATVGSCVLVIISTALIGMMNPDAVVDFGGAIERISSASTLIVIMAIIATLLTYTMTRVRRLTTRQSIVWSLIGFVGGMGTALAVLAIYPQVNLERCPRCDRNRRVERERCEHCDAEWEPPANEGIEIIDDIDGTEATQTEVSRAG